MGRNRATIITRFKRRRRPRAVPATGDGQQASPDIAERFLDRVAKLFGGLAATWGMNLDLERFHHKEIARSLASSAGRGHCICGMSRRSALRGLVRLRANT